MERARQTLAEAVDTLAEQKAIRDRMISDPTAAADQVYAARVAYADAYRARWDTERAYQQAVADYHTTPAGQADLQQTLDRLTREGATEEAAKVQATLAQAVARRQQQTADLAASRAQQARLADLTPAEQAALDQADAAVAEVEAEVRAAEADAEAAVAAYRATDADYRRMEARIQETTRATTAARQEVLAAAEEARAAARALYVQAGVSARFAGYYATDMVEAAAGMDTYLDRDRPAQAVPERALRMKVKRSGPDREAMLVAKTAAETDPTFKAANRRLAEAVAAHRDAVTVEADAHRGEIGPALQLRSDANRRLQQARYAIEDAQARAAKATGRAHRLRAQIAAGAGTEASTVALDESRTAAAIMRNPDGSINAWVYRGPSEGFPHGRYLRATGVTTVQAMSAVNGLVLEDGQVAVARGHYGRSGRGFATETRSGDRRVLVTPPQPGARPLREENVAQAGFYAFIDSTD